jgi:hypothetical protein
MRTCIEVEANFKAILRENIYNPIDKKGNPRLEEDWNINDFQKVNITHHLDNYIVEIPIWSGPITSFRPFLEWQSKQNLSWYQAYNQSKHDRLINFQKANLSNLLNSITGLLVLLSSQFRTESFSPGNQSMGVNTDNYYSGEFGIGEFFIIKFPKNWSINEKYDFNWSTLKDQSQRFEKIDYNII